MARARPIPSNHEFIPHGKAWRRSKLARRTATILDRLPRCVEDAADGGLDLSGIPAVGVVFPGNTEMIGKLRARSAVLRWESIR